MYAIFKEGSNGAGRSRDKARPHPFISVGWEGEGGWAVVVGGKGW